MNKEKPKKRLEHVVCGLAVCGFARNEYVIYSYHISGLDVLILGEHFPELKLCHCQGFESWATPYALSIYGQAEKHRETLRFSGGFFMS